MPPSPPAADTSRMRGLMGLAVALSAAVLIWPAWSGASTSTAVGVSEREWTISLGRVKAPHGRIVFYIHNYGQDDHDIKIRRDGVLYGHTGRIPSGGQVTLSLRLAPGRYSVYCAIPGHRQLGMLAHLRVT
jgi:plastocyanin